MPGKILGTWLDNKFELALSEFILEETARVLAYPEISARIDWSAAQISAYLQLFRFNCEIAALTDEIQNLVADPAVLATLTSSGANYLVTSDQDLLLLRDRFAMVTPAEFERSL
ncbi:MAG: putative toxin-antitoxin system toxin component, PIN family [Burkholderiales bacterium]|nr:putative toxin-antitoxin system toxin component, PIN family [Burkholderiales bacterium]